MSSTGYGFFEPKYECDVGKGDSPLLGEGGVGFGCVELVVRVGEVLGVDDRA
jgi:hypothetical protein